MNAGIYVVEIEVPEHRDRVVVVAPSADAAEELAMARWQAWINASAGAGGAPYLGTPTVDVGRVGDFDPGIMGARLAGPSPVLAIGAVPR